MASRSFILSVGVTPIPALFDNPDRVGWQVVMPSTTKIAGNTGRVHIGKNLVPDTTVGNPTQGIMLIGGESSSEKESYSGDQNVFKGVVWLLASAAAQVVEVEEDSFEAPSEKRAQPVRIVK